MKRLLIISLMISVLTGTACGQRIKDIVDIQGVRGNPLTGIGLLVGLAGTGDTTLPSQQILSKVFRDSGVVLEPDELDGGNIAVVMVTCTLGPFDHEGKQIDVDVSSIGDAKSLKGGILLPTPLKGLDGPGLDGQVYAIAQGPISISGWTASGDKGSISKNHQTVGRIPGGATVETEELADFVEYLSGHRYITFNLRNEDFSTAEQIRSAINQKFPDCAFAVDPGTVKIRIPSEISNNDIAAFIDAATSPDVKVDSPAVVVINERTGTIVVGEKVGISEVAISQGSLVVKVSETSRVSQPTAQFSDAGETKVVPETMIGIDEQRGYLISVPKVVTVSELANSLNAIGASPTDLIAIFNALKKAGALQAKLEIM
ncbi:MAG: flagellar basal body P-ring protein FlgI [Sedimentisphaerales bacterium]|nr:flagellar basal body P-ring protein FlgI [Sedimentisphaerales bacterium]